MNKKRHQAAVESATDSEADSRPCLKRRKQFSHSPSPALESYSVLYVRARAPELQERKRRPWSLANQSSPTSSSTLNTNTSPRTSHNAPPKGPGISSSPAEKTLSGSNVSSPSTLRSDTSPTITPTDPKHSYCIHCAKQLGNLGAIVGCDARFNAQIHTVRCWRCSTDSQQCVPIPESSREAVNRAIALRGTIDEQQGIMNTATGIRNKAKKDLRPLAATMMDLISPLTPSHNPGGSGHSGGGTGPATGGTPDTPITLN
ncbi:MAG: hypothetical protein L6R38_008446 [Xanthoria sp. 2 TBL-2021]|nr:MAG: hypothetical protein L6R38_008446 [Xanthoria sp. 2 TBL-2021]